MKRFLAFAGAIALVCFAMLMPTQRSGAQQSDGEAMKATLTSFFAAATDRDIAKMGALWVQEPSVVLVLPPDKTPAIGWEAAKKSWQARFDSVAEWTVSPKEASNIQINQGTATATTVVAIHAKTKAGAAQSYNVLLTQVFLKRGDRWLLIANHGSRAPD